MTIPDAIRSAMQSAVDEGVFPGAVLGVRVNDRQPLVTVAGRLSSDLTSPLVHPGTLYDLASLTKPLVTTTSVLLLVQQGKLQLDEPAMRVLDELDGSAIGRATTQDLLTHSSGLPGWRPLYERLEGKGAAPGQAHPMTIRRTMLQFIRDEPLEYATGTKSLYSDLGFILLGLMIERVTGQPLDRWYEEAVAAPIKASPLAFSPASVHPAARNKPFIDMMDIAPTEYDRRRNRLLQGEVHDENAAAMAGIAGHAGLFGTADAVLAVSRAWLDAYRGKASILDPALVRRFIARRNGIPQSSWACGWDTPSSPSSTGSYFSSDSFGHLGYTGTSLWVDPRRELEVVLLSNRVHPSRKNEKIREFRPRLHDIVMQEYVWKEGYAGS
jgi:CubicO group peptidase (beta-lactamase class C family)